MSWAFDYAPIALQLGDPDGASEYLIATLEEVDSAALLRALGRVGGVRARTLISRPPIHWTLVELEAPLSRAPLYAALDGLVTVRYIAPARAACLESAPGLDLRRAEIRPEESWGTRALEPGEVTRSSPGYWFLDSQTGIQVDRTIVGWGSGSRLAVIDDDGLDAGRLPLDAEILVELSSRPNAQRHGSLMVAWAVAADDGAHHGVAPAASPRLYLVPKPGLDVYSLPLALARAVFDGADVVVAAGYVDGVASPMLEDALALAVGAGRGGLGTAVVIPTSRETSSPPGGVHASLTLSLVAPASDPRVVCIGPSGRDGGWFLWRDRRGRLRPFANRGPAVRFVAPGDDIADPFDHEGRAMHAESSGASAIAGGAFLLLLAANPLLDVSTAIEVIRRTACTVDPSRFDRAELADHRDLQPTTVDSDGHNAKVGYGRILVSDAVLIASDPFSAALFEIGDRAAAKAWLIGPRPYSPRVAQALAIAYLRDSIARDGFRSIVRHIRLVFASPSRAKAHPIGALVRLISAVIQQSSRTLRDPDLALVTCNVDLEIALMSEMGRVLTPPRDQA